MKQLKFIWPILLLLAGCANSTTHTPRAFIIGDSISLGYTPFVQAELPNWEVTRPNDNCRNTTYTLLNLDKWLTGYYDVITWNNGLWNMRDDPSIVPPGNERWIGTSLEQYRDDIIAIAKVLKARGRRVIFFTTTESFNVIGFTFGKEFELNKIATEELPRLGVEVYDLNGFAKPLEHVTPTDVHFTDDSSKELGEYVAEKINVRN